MPPINQLKLLLSYQRVLAWETKFSNIQWRCLLFILTGERGEGVVAWGKDHKPYSSSSPLHSPGLSASSHCTALSGAVPCTQKYIQVFLKSLPHSYDFFKVFFPPLYPALQVTVVWCSQWAVLGDMDNLVDSCPSLLVWILLDHLAAPEVAICGLLLQSCSSSEV